MSATTREWIDVDRMAPLGEAETWDLAREEYVRMLALLRSIKDVEWSLRTDCAAWTLRDLLGHLVGAPEGFSNPMQMIHQYRAGARFIREGRTDGREPVDGANAVQVSDRAGLPTSELIDRYAAVIEPVLRWRRRLRYLPVNMSDGPRKFSLKQLFEIVLTRDTWIHRVDIHRATGRAPQMTPEHDGRILADAVREWARRTGKPFRLALEGPAGGYYMSGVDGTQLGLDAVEFGRLVSGRGHADGLLATRIVF